MSTAVVHAAVEGIVVSKDKISPAEHGGHIKLTRSCATAKLVKRRGSTQIKTAVAEFEEVKEKFLHAVCKKFKMIAKPIKNGEGSTHQMRPRTRTFFSRLDEVADPANRESYMRPYAANFKSFDASTLFPPPQIKTRAYVRGRPGTEATSLPLIPNTHRESDDSTPIQTLRGSSDNWGTTGMF